MPANEKLTKQEEEIDDAALATLESEEAENPERDENADCY